MTVPQIKAFVICENIIVDQAGRFSLINIYNHLNVVSQFPANHLLKIYLSFFAPQGAHKVIISLAISGQEKVVEHEFLLDLDNKVDFVVEMPVIVESSGVYFITALLDGQELSKTDLIVEEVKA